MKKREIFKIEGDKIQRLRRNCPKCGDGIFLAEHKDRLSCGKCGYTEFKGKKEKMTANQEPVEEKSPEITPGKPDEEVKEQSIETNIEENKIE